MTAITIQLNEAEQAAFQQLLDLALRNAGMNAFNAVSHFVALLHSAAASSAAAAAVQAAAPSTAAATPAPSPAVPAKAAGHTS
jgi:hypothetical protein